MLTYLLYNGIGRVTKDLQEMSTKVDIAIAREAEGCWGHPGSCLAWGLGSSYECLSLLFPRNSNRGYEGSQQARGSASV